MAFAIDLTKALDRKTLCFAGPDPGVPVHAGEDEFNNRLQLYYSAAESSAIENLVALKDELSKADTETFWTRLMEGMTQICNAQYGFVAKRILRDDHDCIVEMPPIGSEGSCLLGTAFYYNDGKDVRAMLRDCKYMAFGAPCGYMKHDKVFIIPNKLQDFILDNPNTLPFPAEAYIGVPLFCEDKCFAHFAMMWTLEGLEQRDLSWAFVELLMHSLEDLIVERLLRGETFTRTPEEPIKTEKKRVIPQEAVTANQSLKPYARGLSHELRTPMQGVVGMLDVMHATVQEAIEGQTNSGLRKIFQDLRENIEAVQDSSRRAVEAADNVVHAYDLNMQIPSTPQEGDDPFNHIGTITNSSTGETRPSIFIEGHGIPANPYKRRRSSPVDWHHGTPLKLRHPRRSSPRLISPLTKESSLTNGVENGEANANEMQVDSYQPSQDEHTPTSGRTPMDRDAYLPPSSKQSRIRDILHMVVNEGLLVGGRPDSAIAEETELGEKIEVRQRSSNGDASTKTITWSVDPDVPEILPVDERDLAKLLSCIFLNAIKFTEAGAITITANITSSGRHVLTKVTDSGTGIPPDFIPRLFQPFSREDDSLTRTKEGLGLGLLVAKGLARKIGGDIQCARSEISGPNHGSEFDIKIPLSPDDCVSRGQSPFTSSSTPLRHSRRDSNMDSSSHDSSIFSGKTRPLSKSTSPLQLSPDNITSKPKGPRRPISALIDAEMNESSRRPSAASPKMLPPSAASSFDRKLAEKHPLTFLVAEDNKINRKLLVNMLGKLGYKDVYEAYDGKEAVRIMKEVYSSFEQGILPAKRTSTKVIKPANSTRVPVDVILMDLWMPEMDGYEATERILDLAEAHAKSTPREVAPPLPTVLAVTADVTDGALLRATQAGMEGFMTKPYKLSDLQRLIEEFSIRHNRVS